MSWPCTFYGFHLAIVQVWCLAAPIRPAVLESVGLVCLATVMLRARRRLRHRAVTFDADPDRFETLRLSAALD